MARRYVVDGAGWPLDHAGKTVLGEATRANLNEQDEARMWDKGQTPLPRSIDDRRYEIQRRARKLLGRGGHTSGPDDAIVK